VVVPAAATGTVTTKEESREFMAVFPDVVRDLTDTGRHLDVPDATKWFAKVKQPPPIYISDHIQNSNYFQNKMD